MALMEKGGHAGPSDETQDSKIQRKKMGTTFSSPEYPLVSEHKRMEQLALNCQWGFL